jgi:hypothetical protein
LISAGVQRFRFVVVLGSYNLPPASKWASDLRSRVSGAFFSKSYSFA